MSTERKNGTTPRNTSVKSGNAPNTAGGIVMRKADSGRKKYIAAVALLVALAAALTVCVQVFFVIDNIKVEGNYHYSKEDIIEKSGISVGQNMYSMNTGDVRAAVLSSLNGINDVTVKRVLPDTVVISVVEYVPAMYVAVGDSYYILSSGMLVLRSTTDIESIENDGLIRIYTPDITGCIAGEELKTADSDIAHLAAEIYSELCDTGMNESVSEINITDKFDITLKYGGSFTIKLGNALRVHEKLSMAKQMIEKAEVKKGIIDVSSDDVSKGIHTWG